MHIYKEVEMGIDSNDLTLETDGGLLNIRVLLLVHTSKGYIFEHHEDGFYFAIGGRVKFNETSLQAAKREIQEELGNVEIDLGLTGVVENFFEYKGTKYHEFNFVYYGELEEDLDLGIFHSDHAGYEYIIPGNACKLDIRPVSILEYLNSKTSFLHSVHRDQS